MSVDLIFIHLRVIFQPVMTPGMQEVTDYNKMLTKAKKCSETCRWTRSHYIIILVLLFS